MRLGRRKEPRETRQERRELRQELAERFEVVTSTVGAVGTTPASITLTPVEPDTTGVLGLTMEERVTLFLTNRDRLERLRARR